MSSHRSLARAFHQPAVAYFIVVADCLSIREASRRLNVASSAVTRQIVQLEESLHVQLFSRSKQRLGLTLAGEILKRQLAKSMHPLEQAISEIRQLQGLQAGVLRIGAAESIAMSALPQLLGDFAQKYPRIGVQASIASSAEVQEMLLDERIDVGICFVTKSDERLDRLFQADVPIGAVIASGHPLAVQRLITFKDLLSYPMAVAKPGISFRDVINDALASSGQLPPLLETDSIRLLADLALAGHHAAIMTPLGLHEDIGSGRLVFRKLTSPSLPTNCLAMLTRAGTTPELAAAIFFDLARERFESLASNWSDL